jgi:hypothetical protein
MSLSNIITKPLLRGVVATASPWQALFARAGLRVYPFKPGCMVRSDSTSTTALTQGLGQIAQNNYVMVCRETFYGASSLFIPDTTRITRVTSDPTAASDDTLTISPPRSLVTGEWLLCLGNDTATTPTTSPNYDGSGLTLYTDNVGTNSNANKYLETAQNGQFSGWLVEGYEVVDLLVTDSDNQPLVVIPLFQPQSGVVV